MHEVFQIALETEPQFCSFGLNLLPLTLGHLAVLRECNSAFVFENKPARLGEVLLAAFVCSQPWEKSRQDLLSKRLFKWVGKWANKCRRGKINIISESSSFFRYWKHYRVQPCVELPQNCTPSRIESPDEVLLEAMLMSEFHLTERDAKSKTRASAVALWAAQGERLGKHRLTRADESWTSRVQKVFEYQRKIDLEILAEAQAQGITFEEASLRRMNASVKN